MRNKSFTNIIAIIYKLALIIATADKPIILINLQVLHETTHCDTDSILCTYTN
jgi:hypothetical protein